MSVRIFRGTSYILINSFCTHSGSRKWCHTFHHQVELLRSFLNAVLCLSSYQQCACIFNLWHTYICLYHIFTHTYLIQPYTWTGFFAAKLCSSEKPQKNQALASNQLKFSFYAVSGSAIFVGSWFMKLITFKFACTLFRGMPK